MSDDEMAAWFEGQDVDPEELPIADDVVISDDLAISVLDQSEE